MAAEGNNSSASPFPANATSWAADDFEQVMYMYIIGAICAVGIPGNLLTFVVLWRVPQKTGTLNMLLALAAVDGLLVLFMFFNIPAAFFLTLPPAVALVFEPTMAGGFFVVQMMSVWIVCYVCLERYVAICFPYRAVTFCTVGNAKRAIVAILVSSLVLTSPLVTDGILEKAGLEKSSGGAAFISIYSSKIFPFLLFFIPCLLLIFTNIRLAQGIRKAKRDHKKFADNQRKDQSHSIAAALNIVAVVTSFLVTQLPNAGIFLLMWAVNYDIELRISLTCVRYILVALNSSVNILVYCLFYRRFRDGIGQLLCCGRKQSGKPRGSLKSTSAELTRVSLLRHKKESV